MLTKNNSSNNGKSLIIFFLLAYGITWIFSALAYFSHSWSSSGILLLPLVRSINILFILLGPALAAVITACLFNGREGIRNLLAGLRIWRISARWLLFIFAYPLALHLLIVGIDSFLSGTSPRFFTSSSASIPAGNIFIVTLGLILVNLVRGFGEELGWRGYALPRLQSRWSALHASLILGVLWSLWHYHPSNIDTLIHFSFWYLLLTLPTTIVFTWVMNSTHGSLFAVIVLHMMIDVAEWIVPVGLYEGNIRQMIINVSVNWMVVVILITLFGAQNLSRRQRVKEYLDYGLLNP